MARRTLEASGHVVASFLDQASTLHLAAAARGLLVDEDGLVLCHTIDVCPELWRHRINPRAARVARFLTLGFVDDRPWIKSIVAEASPGHFGFKDGWSFELAENALTRDGYCSLFASGKTASTAIFRLSLGDTTRTFAHKFGDKYGSSNFGPLPSFPVRVRFDLLAECDFLTSHGSFTFPSYILGYFGSDDAFLSDVFDRYRIIVFPHAVGLRLTVYGLVADRRAFDIFLDGRFIGTIVHNFLRGGEIACLPVSFSDAPSHTVVVTQSERREGDALITRRCLL